MADFVRDGGFRFFIQGRKRRISHTAQDVEKLERGLDRVIWFLKIGGRCLAALVEPCEEN